MVKKFKFGRDTLATKVFNKKNQADSTHWRQRKGALRHRPKSSDRNNMNVLVNHISEGYDNSNNEIIFDHLELDNYNNVQVKD